MYERTSSAAVLLADFQFLTSMAMKDLIDRLPGFQIVGQFTSRKELLQGIAAVEYDLLVLDIFGEDTESLDQITKISQQSGRHMLIITNTQDRATVQALLKAGIKGIVTKSCSEEEITNALKAVSVGHRFYCNSILNLVMESGQLPQEASEPSMLSARELQVLKLIAQGNTTRKVADSLNISIHTVNSHRKNILRKLHISSPIHLIAYAVENGLVTIDYDKK